MSLDRRKTREEDVEEERVVGRRVEAKEIREIFEVLSDFIANKLPLLLKTITDTLYSEENAKKVATSFLVFYKTLVEGGLPEKTALEMAKKYYEESLSLSRILSSLTKSASLEVSK